MTLSEHLSPAIYQSFVTITNLDLSVIISGQSESFKKHESSSIFKHYKVN